MPRAKLHCPRSVTVKVLQTLFRAHARLSAAGVILRLDEMDSRHQTHFFNNTSVLSMVCERTAQKQEHLGHESARKLQALNSKFYTLTGAIISCYDLYAILADTEAGAEQSP